MKIILFSLLVSLTFLGSFAQQNLRGNRVSADTIKHSTVATIPTWPATGLKEFYHQDTLKAIDSIGQIYYLTKCEKIFQYSILTTDENSIPTTILLGPNTKVFYNGSLIPDSLWSGLNTYQLFLNFQTRKFDFLSVNTSSK